MKKIIILLIIIMGITGCAEKKRLIQKTQEYTAPAKLAILPSVNLSNDVLGGIVIRNLTYTTLKEENKNYDVQDIDITDSLLNDEGISEGGLLNLFTPLELCQILGVDGLLYVDVYDMGMKVIPFYHSRYIDVQYRMYNFSKIMWQKPIKIANRVMDIKGAINAISNIADKNYKDVAKDVVGNVALQEAVKIGTATLFEHELKPEMILVTNELKNDIPFGNSKNVNYCQNINEKLEILNEQKKSNSKLSLGDEEEVQEEEIKIVSNGVNVYTN